MSGKKQGRLLEIKCPPTRTLDGKVPIRYYAQMQLQAEVCDVEAVEYVEVQFAAKAKDQCSPEILKGVKKQAPWMGVVAVVAESVDAAPASYQYVYSPLFPATEEGYAQTMAWIPGHGVALELSVWIVKDWYHQTVPRNRRWWTEVAYPAYVRFWETVDAARKDGRFRAKLLCDDEDSSDGVGEDSGSPPDRAAALRKRASLLCDESDDDKEPVTPVIPVETAETNPTVPDSVAGTDGAATAAAEDAAGSVAETGETKASDSPPAADSSA